MIQETNDKMNIDEGAVPGGGRGGGGLSRSSVLELEYEVFQNKPGRGIRLNKKQEDNQSP